MKLLNFLFLNFTFSLVFSLSKLEQPPYEGYRLVKIDERRPAFWVPFEVIEVLSRSELNFMDVTDHQIVDASLTPASSAIPTAPVHQDIVEPLIQKIEKKYYKEKLIELTSFINRYYTSYGVESAEWVFNLVTEISNNRSDITVSKFSHSWPQPSVIARIQGTKTDELVILGAHQDSIAPGMPEESAPGADDDGSGTTALFEIFRILIEADFKPEYTLEFQWYAAEEVGLLGSQAIAEYYQSQRKSVRAMMQLDMIGYNEVESTVAIITDFTSPQLNAFNRLLVEEYLEIGWTDTSCGYGCSDHASWNKYGYPSSFPFEAQPGNTTPHGHSPNDIIDYISLEHAKEFVKLGLSFAIELSHE